jgi:hypothetical protein
MQQPRVKDTAAAARFRPPQRCLIAPWKVPGRRRDLLHSVALTLDNWGLQEPIPRARRRAERRRAAGPRHAAWAPGRIGTGAARQALAGRAEAEEDAWVREEIAAAPQGRRRL